MEHRADLRQEPVLSLDLSGDERTRPQVCSVLDAHPFPPAVERQLADIDRVADRILQRLGIIFAVPHGRHRIALVIQRVAIGRRGVGHAIEAARLVERVALIPAGQLQLVDAGGQGQLGDGASPVQAIFGRAERQRCRIGDRRAIGIGGADRGRGIGGDPRSLPLVVMIVAGRGQRQIVGQLGIKDDPAQIIAAQTGGVIIAVVQRHILGEGQAHARIRRRKAV